MMSSRTEFQRSKLVRAHARASKNSQDRTAKYYLKTISAAPKRALKVVAACPLVVWHTDRFT